MTFSKYSTYKDSGVEWLGEVPEHWEVKPLKYGCSVFPSNVDKKSYEGQKSVFLCNYTDVYYNEKITEGMNFMPASATDEQIVKFSLRAGDVIFTKDSETADDIAIATYVPENIPGVICGYHLSIARPSQYTDGNFIKRFFDSHSAKSYFAVSANGLTRVGLSQYSTDNLPVPFPPKVEQTRIARFLDHETARIDTLIEEQQRLIELLKEKRQAVISHAVTKGLDPTVPMKNSGVEWLGEVPAHWELTAVKYVVEGMSQGWSPQCDNYPAEDGEWGVLKVGCVNGGVFNPAENKRLPNELEPDARLTIKQGDLLISRANTRDLVGSAAVAVSDYPWLMLCDKIYRLRLNAERVAPEFLALYLGSNAPRSQIELAASGASDSMQNISQSVVTDMPLPLPPVGEQKAILRLLGDTLKRSDELVEDVTIQRRLLQERRSALISAAVTGKIDVRGWQPPTGAPSPELAKEAV